MSHATLRIDGDRLWARLEALGEVGAVHGAAGERGCARLALTDADREGRDLVLSWMHDLGLSVVVDAVGNVVGTRAGTNPQAAAVMVGSHNRYKASRVAANRASLARWMLPRPA